MVKRWIAGMAVSHALDYGLDGERDELVRVDLWAPGKNVAWHTLELSAFRTTQLLQRA